jgi:hypothetical protein
MDENKENLDDNQDLTVDGEGSMNQGSVIEVKTESADESEPAVNDIQPPPVTDNSSEEDGETDVASAVSFIAGDNKDSDDSAPVPVSVEEGEDKVVEPESVTEDVSNSDSEPENMNEVKEQEVETTEEAPDTTETAADSTESTDSFSDMPTAPLTTVTPDVTAPVSGMSNNEQSQPHAHRNNRKLAVIVTLFAAMIMAGAAVYVFISAQDNAEPVAPATSITEQSSAPVEPATEDDVNQTINEIDQTLESLDESDLGEDTISDDTLGL